MKPMLKAPGTVRLKLKYDNMFSILLQFCFNFAFNFSLRRYLMGAGIALNACGTFYGTTQCADLTASGNNVAIAATEVIPPS